ncbi:hypothetical protein ACH5RR_015125 [Cinchona calisaya]|uniref:MADS-box domain-containing protein n=1 Tax=Cinchona calisaya TaxID=153742 RepID=A0ABD2ZS94_9GENT
MASKRTRGRQKIEMKKIEKEDDMYASFSKRRNGIFKKASEICTTCKTDIGVIIFSPTGKPHSFFHPTVDKVVNRFLKINQPTSYADRLVDALGQDRIDKLNHRLDELEAQKEIEEERAKKLDELGAPPHDMFDWLGMPIEQMDMEMVTNLQSTIANLLGQLEEHAKELKNGASSSHVPTRGF